VGTMPWRSPRNWWVLLVEPVFSLIAAGGLASSVVLPSPRPLSGWSDVTLVDSLTSSKGLAEVAVIVSVRYLWFGGHSCSGPVSVIVSGRPVWLEQSRLSVEPESATTDAGMSATKTPQAAAIPIHLFI